MNTDSAEAKAACGESSLTGGLAHASCGWYQDGDYDSDTWATGCGHYFTVNDGAPKDNGMKFCCFCGGRLDQHLQAEPEDEDEPANKE